MGLEIALSAKTYDEGILVPDYPEMFFTAIVEYAQADRARFPLLATVDLSAVTAFEAPQRADLLAEWKHVQTLAKTTEDLKKWEIIRQWLEDEPQFLMLEFLGD